MLIAWAASKVEKKFEDPNENVNNVRGRVTFKNY